uniref:Endonuclease I n=1 Tax=uncultured marine virus TaxID=186617 RepID=A0A0F7L8G6_9VIRU|nr:endonuclease I [uncultured marine virus]
MLCPVGRHEATFSLKDNTIIKNKVRGVVVVLNILNPHGLVCKLDPCLFHSKSQALFEFRTESRHP